MKFSRYVIKVYSNKKYILYNTVNDSIIVLSKKEYEKPSLFLYLKLKAMSFFIKDKKVLKRIKSIRNSSKNLLDITISLTEDCNLKCSYCSQNNHKRKGIITEELIDEIIEYIRNCIKINKYKDVIINLFGGEPLLAKERIIYLVNKMKKLNNLINIYYSIETNGILLDDGFLKNFKNIVVGISITPKEDHDNFRIFKNGSGSYDTILSNIKKCKTFDGEKRILKIRYNVNQNNYNLFSNFVRDIRQLKKVSYIQLAYTYNFEYNTSENKLDYNQYKKWYTNEAMEILIKNGFEVGYIHPSYNACKAYEKHNIKIFSDGKLAMCNAHLYNENQISIKDLNKNISLINEIFNEKNIDLLIDRKCETCSNLLLCGGKYLCRSDDYCNFVDYDVKEFIKKYIDLEEKYNYNKVKGESMKVVKKPKKIMSSGCGSSKVSSHCQSRKNG